MVASFIVALSDLGVCAAKSPAANLVGRRVRLEDGETGVVQSVYGSRLTSHDTAKLDTGHEPIVNGCCLVE